MIAILCENLKAFTGENVNGLKAGYYLHLPTLEQIEQFSAHESVVAIMQQNKDCCCMLWIMGLK